MYKLGVISKAQLAIHYRVTQEKCKKSGNCQEYGNGKRLTVGHGGYPESSMEIRNVATQASKTAIIPLTDMRSRKKNQPTICVPIKRAVEQSGKIRLKGNARNIYIQIRNPKP